MLEYIAAMRITRTADSPALFAAGAIRSIPGVTEAEVDRVTGQVWVRYDRSSVTIGDIVRWIEDQGLRVLSVAQEREGNVAARSASA